MDVDGVIKLLSTASLNGADLQLPPLSDPDFLVGKRVLVTGAGGSIGSAFSRIAAQLGLERLVMLDRDDSALHALRCCLDEVENAPKMAYYLRDICDESELRDTFLEECPQVILHAAALKHVPLLEENPAEAYRVNVQGTRSALLAAAGCSADVFVNVSTDKASNPASVLGITKRLGERMTSYVGASNRGRYVSVRFGNVIGSRGSILPTFMERIKLGQPLIVTHEDVTRFMMSIDETIHLIMCAAANGSSGETLIADMGQQVRILDLARSLVKLSGKDLPIQITGLRPGDKLHEDHHDDSEWLTTGPNLNGFLRVKVAPVAPDSLHLEGFLRSLDSLRPVQP